MAIPFNEDIYKLILETISISVCSKFKFKIDGLSLVKNIIDWDLASQYLDPTIQTIEVFKNKINFLCLSFNTNLTETIIDNYKKRLNWIAISLVFRHWTPRTI